MDHFDITVTAGKGLEPLLLQELIDLGGEGAKETRSSVVFRGTLEQAYRVCLWSRVANRVLLGLARFQAQDEAGLYQGAAAIDWQQHIPAGVTLAVECHVHQGFSDNSQFLALKVKDAIVDVLRAARGERPDVERKNPDVRIHSYIYRQQVTLSLDISGDSLHRRGYREQQTAAPLKENLAAALLYRARWPELARQGCDLVDPMCGSGTLLIEAAMMASDKAPGLERMHWGFDHWPGHDGALWQGLVQEAQQRWQSGLSRLRDITIRGGDQSGRALSIARENIRLAGFEDCITLVEQRFQDTRPPRADHCGLFITNPPYGERLAKGDDLNKLYRDLGETLRNHYRQWQATIIVADKVHGQQIGLRAHKLHKVYNGALECTLLHFTIEEQWFFKDTPPKLVDASLLEQPGAQMVFNRLQKNLRQLRRWAEREGVSCYRTYDADLPEYAVAADLYHDCDGVTWLHVQEYAPPASVDERKAAQRLKEALAALAAACNVDEQHLFVKTRRRQKGSDQYQRSEERGEFYQVQEGASRLWVNFADYLDTGLFLDHRNTRLEIARLARGKRFLNLYCYTGAATVQAAVGGAEQSTSVDLSNTYLDWAQRNLALNKQGGGQHKLVRADVRSWLREQRWGGQFDLIFLDPPTFSNSKATPDVLDIQRDHVELIDQCMRLLAKDGLLIFSNNFRRFKLDPALGERFKIEDRSQASIPEDFKRNPRIHYCWHIRHSA